MMSAFRRRKKRKVLFKISANSNLYVYEMKGNSRWNLFSSLRGISNFNIYKLFRKQEIIFNDKLSLQYFAYCRILLFLFGLQVNNTTLKFLIPVPLQCGIGFKNLFSVMFIFKVSKCILNNKKILIFNLNTVSRWQLSLNFSSISSTGSKCTCNRSNGTEK